MKKYILYLKTIILLYISERCADVKNTMPEEPTTLPTIHQKKT
jgi:hypothetical protein